MPCSHTVTLLCERTRRGAYLGLVQRALLPHSDACVNGHGAVPTLGWSSALCSRTATLLCERTRRGAYLGLVQRALLPHSDACVN